MKPIKLGLNLGHFGPQMHLPVEQVKKAEALGFHSAWTAEAFGSDAVTPLAYLAACTSRIKLGTAIMQMPARAPTMTAMQASTVDAMAGKGRFIAGIGTSNANVTEGWYGAPWGKPYHRMRDYIAIMRKVFQREEPVTHQGKGITLPLPAETEGALGVGKPLKSILHPNPDIPIWTGCGTELMVTLTAEIAGGWLPLGWSPKAMDLYGGRLKAGFEKAGKGKGMDDFEIMPSVGVIITDDVKAALDAMRPGLAAYVGGLSKKGKNFHKDRMIKFGYAEAADRVQELALAGHYKEAQAAIPDEFLDDQNLIGPAARIREKWPAWANSGCTGLGISTKQDEALDLLAELADTRGQISAGT